MWSQMEGSREPSDPGGRNGDRRYVTVVAKENHVRGDDISRQKVLNITGFIWISGCNVTLQQDVLPSPGKAQEVTRSD